MRITVAVGALPVYPLRTSFVMASNARADGIELLLNARSKTANASALLDLANATNVRITSVHAILRFRDVSFDQKLADDITSIQIAANLPDCEVVVLHPPITGPRPSHSLNRWLESIVSEQNRVRPDLRLALENRAENHDGIERQLLDDLTVLRSVAGEWDTHVTLDLAHAASWGTDVVAAIDAVMPRLVNLHLSDARPATTRGGIRNGLFRDHLFPGEGHLPIDHVLVRLEQYAYEGLVTIELSPVSLRAWWPPAAARRLRESVEKVRQFSRVAPTRAWHDAVTETSAQSPERS